MGTLTILVDDETTESQPKRFLTLTLFAPDGSRSFIGLDGTQVPSWTGRWVTLARVPDEPNLWEVSVGGIPAGEYYAQFRMVAERAAPPVYRGPAHVPAESVDVRIGPIPLAMARGYARDLPAG